MVQVRQASQVQHDTEKNLLLGGSRPKSVRRPQTEDGQEKVAPANPAGRQTARFDVA